MYCKEEIVIEWLDKKRKTLIQATGNISSYYQKYATIFNEG